MLKNVSAYFSFIRKKWFIHLPDLHPASLASLFFNVFILISGSGLNLASVARLRGTWEKLPSKYEKHFQDLQDLFDPSRNMAKYRNILSSQSMQPPIIPLFPVVKKDMTFLHEGIWKLLEN